MDIGTLGINYVYAFIIIVLGILVALIARSIVNWLKTKASTTDTSWDDIIIATIGTTGTNRNHSNFDLYFTEIF